MEILVEVKNEILGDSVFWRGPAEKVSEIRNIPARQTAEAVAKDGQKRVCGMWHVSAVPNAALNSAGACARPVEAEGRNES